MAGGLGWGTQPQLGGPPHKPATSFLWDGALASLAEQGTLELAVKASPHPPARWVHESGEVGSEVAIRIGGSFSPPGGAPRDRAPVAWRGVSFCFFLSPRPTLRSGVGVGGHS